MKIKKHILSLLMIILIAFSSWFTAYIPVSAGAIPAEGVHTTLGNALYINQDWMNYRVNMTGYGINCSLGIGEMKNYPVFIHTVRGITICELENTTLVDAFITNINQDLSKITSPVNSNVFKNGASTLSMTGTRFYQLNGEARNWILGVLQQSLMEKPENITLELSEAYLAENYSAQSVSMSPDYILSGTCTTSFKTSSNNRSTNIAVAASHLNNTIIMPGQSVSVSNAITPRTTENGYKTAHAYLNGEIVDQLGGGICQVSSTVYNAALNSGMTILERHAHSMPVSYLPLGQDAAISSGSKDMIFQNPYSMPVVMQTVVENKHLTVNIYIPSGVLNGTTYKFWSKKRGGLSAESFLTTYVNGVESATVSLGVSKYMALPADEEN